MENAVARLEGFLGDASFEGSSQNAERIRELEQEIMKMKSQSKDMDKYSCSALAGNLPSNLSLKDAELWIKEKMQTVSSSCPEMYCKGDFKGIIFMKFASQHERNQYIQAFAKQRLSHGSNRIWITADKPMELRVQHALLFKVKKLLIDWQFKGLWVDEANNSLSWNGDLVMQINIHNNHLDLQYGDTWQAFLQQGNLDELINNAVSSLHNASIAKTKGKGKGKINHEEKQTYSAVWEEY